MRAHSTPPSTWRLPSRVLKRVAEPPGGGCGILGPPCAVSLAVIRSMNLQVQVLPGCIGEHRLPSLLELYVVSWTYSFSLDTDFLNFILHRTVPSLDP